MWDIELEFISMTKFVFFLLTKVNVKIFILLLILWSLLREKWFKTTNALFYNV